EILEAIENDTPYGSKEKELMKVGVHVLPKFPKDTTDRNRTSPFAFTGNKFEFRMLGSSNSISGANIIINSAVAESLRIYADRLEKADDFESALHEMIKKTIRDHKRIIFNGNGYDEAWIKEATEKRGLLNYPTTVDCMPHLLDEKNVTMLTSHKVFTKAELESRCEIQFENYCKTVMIEARTMADMASTQILPAVEKYCADTAAYALAKKSLSADIACGYEGKLVAKLSALADEIDEKTEALAGLIEECSSTADVAKEAVLIKDKLIPAMAALRTPADKAETLTAKSYWPFPTYADLLFGVK
ncbi:MAG: glutamine synthetase type III, partial [Firmicutes bacterium]|nr:glutamine synthetase type III [Bacillota bacterium]